MRTGGKDGARQKYRNEGDDGSDARIGHSADFATKQECREADGNARQDNNAFPSPGCIGAKKEQLRQPLLSNPAVSGKSEGICILDGQAEISPDIAPHLDMPKCIWIAENETGGVEHTDHGDEGYEKPGEQKSSPGLPVQRRLIHWEIRLFFRHRRRT